MIRVISFLFPSPAAGGDTLRNGLEEHIIDDNQWKLLGVHEP